MKQLREARREELLLDIRQLLLTDPSVRILRPLAGCLASGKVPISVLLASGQQLSLIFLARREPVNFRVSHDQQHVLSAEQLAGMERPPGCRNLAQTLAWIKDVFFGKQSQLLR